MHKLITALDLSPQQKKLLETYLELLSKWNKTYNLTAIKDYDEMVVKHILDSLSIKEYVAGNTIIDVGTGAGLPGLVLAIVFPDKHFTLLDSNGKKIRFLIQAIHELGLKNCATVQARAEDYKPEKTFDCVTSRAFADLKLMLDLTRHLAHENTVWLAMKGDVSDEELSHIAHAKKINLSVPGLDEKRALVLINSCTKDLKFKVI